MRNHQSTFKEAASIFLISIIFILLLGTVNYLLASPINPFQSSLWRTESDVKSKNANDFSQWQEYNTNLTDTLLFTHLNAPFSFKYPKQWKLSEAVDGIKVYSFDDNIGYDLGTVPKGRFMVQILPDIEDRGREEIRKWCKENLHQYEGPFQKIVFEGYLDVNGVKSYLVDYEQNKFDSLRQVCIPKDNFKVIIYGEPLDDGYLEIFDQILSTFKFMQK